jgi:hypothetical protein
MKRSRKIYTTWCNESVSERHSSNSILFHVFLEHDHVKDVSIMQHHWFDLHVWEIAEWARALHDQIEVKSIIESRIDFHKNNTRDESENKALTQNIKKMNVEKLSNVWRDFVVSLSLNDREHVKKYANRIKENIESAINETMSWKRFFLKTKFFWNDRCVEVVTTIKRKRRKWTTTHSKNVSRNYLRVSNEKKKTINREKKKKFRQIFCIICDSSSNLWRFADWAKFKSHLSKKIFKISDLIRRDRENNVLECAKDFNVKTRFLFEFFFLIQQMRIWTTFRRITIQTQSTKRLN